MGTETPDSIAAASAPVLVKAVSGPSAGEPQTVLTLMYVRIEQEGRTIELRMRGYDSSIYFPGFGGLRVKNRSVFDSRF